MNGRRLVSGVGINDSPTPIKGCPLYRRWAGMLDRCYGTCQRHNRHNYLSCQVDPRWHLFSVFADWMASQQWQGKELDKDLLVPANNLYSPDRCVFVSKQVNYFILDCKASRGVLPLGVDFHNSSGRYRARVSNPFSGTSEHLGTFSTPDEAHLRWKVRKFELAKELAARQEDGRVAQALINRYTFT